MIQRKPQPVFAAIWILWTIAVLVAVGMPDRPLFGLLVLVSFFAIEVPAAILKSGGARDTLSEITTWAVSKTSKTRLPIGFSAALGIDVLVIAWLVGRTFTHYSHSVVLGTGTGGLTVAWLWWHFRSPDIVG